MEFNIVEKSLIFLTIIITFLGIWLNFFEKYTPAWLLKITFYGQITYRAPRVFLYNYIEFSKASFKYFYIYASFLCWSSVVYMVQVYLFGAEVRGSLRNLLETFLENQQPVAVSAVLPAMLLLTAQCSRRMHETLRLQVFSEASKMNVLHFAVGVGHYTLCIVSVIGASPIFCGSKHREDIQWLSFKSVLTLIPCTLLFAWASYEQHQSNIILADLRKDKDTGAVVTQEYRMPHGRLFNYISSPHRLTEIVIYLALAILMQTQTYFIIFVWVFCNQLQGSIGTHIWYKRTFKNYPKQRYALFPGII